MELKGKVALVTGGSRGIGYETCKLLASQGANIIICSRNENECLEVAKELSNKYGVEALALDLDVTNLKNITIAIKKVKERFGNIDILINNAGATILKPFVETTIDEWHSIHNINLHAPFYLCKEIVPAMITKGEGIIINVASIWATKGGPDRSAYISSKHAVIGFTKALGEELKGYGIRVNAVCPGPVDTKMTNDLGPNLNKSGWLQPIDIANIILDLCLPKSKAITATSIEAFGNGKPVGL